MRLCAALPLALYRERSVSREAALAALQDGELTWEIVYTSPSLVRPGLFVDRELKVGKTRQACLGIENAQAHDDRARKKRRNGQARKRRRAHACQAAAALAAALLALAQGLSRPTI
jgi:hypothetical protein